MKENQCLYWGTSHPIQLIKKLKFDTLTCNFLLSLGQSLVVKTMKITKLKKNFSSARGHNLRKRKLGHSNTLDASIALYDQMFGKHLDLLPNSDSSDGRMVKASASGAVDSDLIPSRVKPMTLKLVFTASLLDA